MVTMADTLTVVVILALCLCDVSAQEETTLRYDLTEEAPPGYVVGDIRTGASIPEGYTYSIMRSPYGHYFDIEFTRGVMTTAMQVDRDAIPECMYREACSVTLNVMAQNQGDTNVVRVIVNILDIQDNRPAFEQETITVRVAENTAVDTSIPIPSALDPDSPQYSVQRYSLVQGQPTFSLRTTASQVDSTMDVFLVLRTPLDYEVTSSYDVIIAAYDGPDEDHVTRLHVHIEVTDINDHSPVFTHELYEVTVMENTTVNSVVATVNATDADSGDNGAVVYGLTSRTRQEYGHLFDINNRTGEIRITAPLSYSSSTMEYSLGVTARNRNPESLRTQARVIITVRDTNDNAPVITVISANADGHVEISESTLPDKFVTFISVEDPDSGVNGEFSCSIDNPVFKLQNIYGTDYKLLTNVNTRLNREEHPQYDVTFSCVDHGDPPQSSSRVITVNILDENDSPPVFPKQTVSVTLEESTPVGTSVAHLQAQDADLGQNALLEYRALGDANVFLLVDPVNGSVTLRHELDYEKQTSHTFRILASDHGVPPMSATATLLLTVLDVDDELPEFQFDNNQGEGTPDAGSYTFYVYEGLPPGTEIDHVVAVDRDTDGYNEFRYRLSDESYTNVFYLDPDTGRLYTRTSLDRETHEQYDLTVLAVTNNQPEQTSSATVHVVVLDTNDHVPEWTFPVPENNTVYVMSNSEVRSVVTTVTATDQDDGINARLIYRLEASTERGRFFDVHSNTGDISVAAELHDLADKMVTLTLQVSDSQATAEATLHIVVNRSVEVAAGSSQNLTIVISVAVVSGVLTVVLIVAIIWIHRQDHHDNKLRRNARNNSDQVLIIEAGEGKYHQQRKYNNPTTAASKHATSFTEITDPTVQIAASQGGQAGHKYADKAEVAQQVHGGRAAPTLAQQATGYHPTQQPITAAITHSYPHEMQLRASYRPNGAVGGSVGEYMCKDSDSTNSSGAASLPDSGRGSNDDADCRSADSKRDAQHMNSLLSTPQKMGAGGSPAKALTYEGNPYHPTPTTTRREPHASRPNTDSFKAKLSDIVKMKNEHANDMPDTYRGLPVVSPKTNRSVSVSVPPRPPRASSTRDSSSAREASTSGPNANNSSSNLPNSYLQAHGGGNGGGVPVKRASSYGGGEAIQKPRPHPYPHPHPHRGRVDDYSINGETSGTEYISDEDTEHVYYLNSGRGSSHV